MIPATSDFPCFRSRDATPGLARRVWFVMRRTHMALTAVSALAALGVLVACGEQPEDHAGQAGQPTVELPVSNDQTTPPNQAPPPAEVDWPAPPEGVRLVPAGQVDASALPEDYPRMVWFGDDDGRVLGLYGREGGCTTVNAAPREQAATAVTISLVEVTTSAGPCTMDLRFPALNVMLDAPLDDRTVVLQRETIGPSPK